MHLLGFFLSLHSLLTMHGHRNLKPSFFFLGWEEVVHSIILYEGRRFGSSLYFRLLAKKPLTLVDSLYKATLRHSFPCCRRQHCQLPKGQAALNLDDKCQQKNISYAIHYRNRPTELKRPLSHRMWRRVVWKEGACWIHLQGRIWAT